MENGPYGDHIIGYRPQNMATGPAVISAQPSAIMQPSTEENWMPAPQGNPHCPPGLEYLTSVDQLLIHQKVEVFEAITTWETQNKYIVKNNMGQKIFYAKEESGCLMRQCCGSIRPFELSIQDNFEREVIRMSRPLACTSCWCPCWLQNMKVYTSGVLAGSIEQSWSIIYPKYKIKNATGDVVLLMEGPFCTCSICGTDVNFKILSRDNAMQVGTISKQWSGLGREALTDADMFGINFPMDLDVRMKAVMLGACFLIDFMFFEKQGRKGNDSCGMF